MYEETPKLEGQPDQKIEKLFDHCFEIKKIEEGDKIPVGGESLMSSETNVYVIADFEKLNDFLQSTHTLAEGYNLSKIKDQLVAQGVEITPKTFAELIAFSRSYNEEYPANPEGAALRKKLYEEKEVKISDVFASNSAECAEIAALAQVYLQQAGVDSLFFSGEVLWKKDDEFAEAHSFIILKDKGKTYIYDPANPLSIPNGKFPSLYTIEKDFDTEVRTGQKRFVTAENIGTKNEAYFGVGSNTNVDPERHIV